MPLTNAQKQARWRERNVVVLTDEPATIAKKLTGLDPTTLAKVYRLIGNHLTKNDRDTLKVFGNIDTRHLSTAEIAKGAEILARITSGPCNPGRPPDKVKAIANWEAWKLRNQVTGMHFQLPEVEETCPLKPKAPHRSELEQAVDAGQLGMSGTRSKKKTLAAIRQFIAAQKELERAYMASEVSQEEFDAKSNPDWRVYEEMDQPR